MQRARHELGDATAAGRLAVERPPVEALHEPDRRLGQQRAEETGHEVRAEVADVGVEPAEDVAVGASSDFHSRVALARSPAQLGQDRRRRRRRGRRPTTRPRRWRRWSRRRSPRPRRRGRLFHQGAAHGRHDVADGGFLVAGREAHRDRGAGVGLGSARSAAEVVMDRGRAITHGSRLGGAKPSPLARGRPVETIVAATRSSRAAEGQAL